MELKYGDSRAIYSWIEYELGPLMCSGKALNYPSDTFASSFFFKAAYNPVVDGYNILEVKNNPRKFCTWITHVLKVIHVTLTFRIL